MSVKTTKTHERYNWPVTILLIIGLITVLFPLYLTIVIAFKQPSEMSNTLESILCLPRTWDFSNFAEAIEVTDFGIPLGRVSLSPLPRWGSPSSSTRLQGT